MTVPNPNNRQDPMAQLDAAMDETFQELAQRGRGVSDSEVAQQQPRRQRSQRPPRQAAPEDEAPWFAEEQPRQEQPRQEQPRRRRRAAPEDTGPDPAAVILEEAETEESDDRARRRSGPQRDERGRFLPSRDTDDRDEYDESDEDDEDDARADGRRYAEVEEADVDDDDVESEGRGRAEDEDDEDQRPRRGRRRYPRAVRDEIDRQVKERVAKVVAENETLREQQRNREMTDNQAFEFLLKAVGTQEQRQQLQATVNNTGLPIQQRNQAAAILKRYLSNEQYARQYGQAMGALRRQQVTEQRKAGVERLARYQVQLDPAIVGGEDESALLLHVAQQAVKAYRAQRRTNRDTRQRQDANRRGLADERAVRNGAFGRDSLASSNGRRANGRVARADPLRRAMGTSRGLSPDSSLPAPTDEVLKQLRNGDITFADLGFR